MVLGSFQAFGPFGLKGPTGGLARLSCLGITFSSMCGLTGHGQAGWGGGAAGLFGSPLGAKRQNHAKGTAAVGTPVVFSSLLLSPPLSLPMLAIASVEDHSPVYLHAMGGFLMTKIRSWM